MTFFLKFKKNDLWVSNFKKRHEFFVNDYTNKVVLFEKVSWKVNNYPLVIIKNVSALKKKLKKNHHCLMFFHGWNCIVSLSFSRYRSVPKSVQILFFKNRYKMFEPILTLPFVLNFSYGFLCWFFIHCTEICTCFWALKN